MKNLFLLIVVYMAFISLGLPDGIFGVAWPSIRIDLGQPLEAAGIISVILMLCSALSSFMNGRIVRKTGTGKLVLISCIMTGSALLGYSFIPSFAWLIFLAFPLGFGQGAVDSSLNNYVANHYSSRHMSWLHCFWGVGAMSGPLILSAVMRGGGTWRKGYLSICLIQLLLAVLFFISLGLWQESTKKEKEDVPSSHETKKKFLTDISPWLSILMFFVYTGAEYTVGLWAGSMLIESRGLTGETAGLWISFYYGSIMLGRFLTGFIVNKLGNRFMIKAGLILSAFGIVLIFFRTCPALTMIGLIMCGLGFAPIYPCMMHETPKRFDADTSRSLIGYQVGAACIGGSFITAGLGVLFSKITLELMPLALLVLIACMFIASELLNKKTPAKESI